MKKATKFSIIIPFKIISQNLLNNLIALEKQTYKNFEVILIPDDEINLDISAYTFDIKVILSGDINPGQKRDKGSKSAKYEYLAFIDDDAYPPEQWLKVANDLFVNNKNIHAIGGPGIDDGGSYFQKLSGKYLRSRIFGFSHRYQKEIEKKYFDDWPSVNLIISKEKFHEVGGFSNSYWPGEDTVLCSKLKSLNISILYSPDLYVFHERRVNLYKYLI